ncbi:Ent-copalyl diphosphate synthase 1, chloroplastic [Ananas comosus]|uniref:Ent-copalyl diphosphate synthase 1, chloroplastic n=1 Tax=Ananas comosus TaxID=4615 RepID=A0A199V2Z8_ANACO|nr:Ent-copalyl diphosphate synthase 1, chloroplastic [Ananas comosus]
MAVLLGLPVSGQVLNLNLKVESDIQNRYLEGKKVDCKNLEVVLKEMSPKKDEDDITDFMKLLIFTFFVAFFSQIPIISAPKVWCLLSLISPLWDVTIGRKQYVGLSSTTYVPSPLNCKLMRSEPLEINSLHATFLLPGCMRTFGGRGGTTVLEDGVDSIGDGVSHCNWLEESSKLDDEQNLLEVPGLDLWKMINEVKATLGAINDGEITISAYDTAWVTLIEKQDGGSGPQFPSCVRWIVDNQLHDGSWGDAAMFSAHDRMINTLACIVALKLWGVHLEKYERGLSFLRENMWRLAEEEPELMNIGFEIAFPSLVEMAKNLGLDIPYDDPALKDIYARRSLKLKSLEGMRGLDWVSLLKLQCVDGSFLFSPASTAYAFMQTRDEKCFDYLQRTVKRFNGGVPNVYPVDLFEHLWVVDRLARLGISRYFEHEIKSCVDYASRYWTEEGICWARNSPVHDVDDTAMGFRLLRLHGYDVSSNVFRKFEKDGEFICFAGQSSQAVTGMYNLNRAAQLLFPGEKILERAKGFSYAFLREKQACNKLTDKWIIAKDLPGQVEYALDFPWYANLPRIETRLYLDQYGGASDIWIGKILYRMPVVKNDLYLELAKADFNQCQALHQLEWLGLQMWYEENGLGKYGVNKKSMLRAYFLAVSSIFEPDRAAERLGWARTAVLADAVSAYFCSKSCTEEMRLHFIRDFLKDDWHQWLVTWREEGTNGWAHAGARRSGTEDTGLLLGRTVEICGGRFAPTDQAVDRPEYVRLTRLTSSLSRLLSLIIRRRRTTTMLLSLQGVAEKDTIVNKIDEEVDSEMQELVQCVLQSSSNLNNTTEQTFLSVVKSFYYLAHCPYATLDTHISKVIFHRVSYSSSSSVMALVSGIMDFFSASRNNGFLISGVNGKPVTSQAE